MNLWPSPDALAIATPHQREKYELATRGPVGILGGNPGVGKTWITAQIIKSVISQYGLSQVAIATPTGKAAQRVNELLIEHQIHGISATTVHRLLGVQRAGHDGKGWGFRYGRDLPLPFRFVFVDEFSMMGIPLFTSLLAALRPGTHLLLIGDFAQLPPVEHGAPLRDMIAAGLPYGELTEPMRNEGDIVIACRDVKEGRQLRPSPCVDIEAGHNLPHIEAARPNFAMAALAGLLRNCPPGIDPVWQVQVICAINEKSEVSRKALNTMLQNILNDEGERLDKMAFRMGDKVICGTNQMLPVVECPFCNYDDSKVNWVGSGYQCQECDRFWKIDEMPTDFVANGEMGQVVHLDQGLLHVAFEAPKRTLRVAAGVMNSFDLGYCVTTHKAQGSQWPIVMVVADDSRAADRVTSFEWHRTAYSRAEKLCFTIGQLKTIHRQCRKSALRDRKTFLTERLK